MFHLHRINFHKKKLKLRSSISFQFVSSLVKRYRNLSIYNVLSDVLNGYIVLNCPAIKLKDLQTFRQHFRQPTMVLYFPGEANYQTDIFGCNETPRDWFDLWKITCYAVYVPLSTGYVVTH